MRRPVRSIAISLPLALIATLASTAPARAALSSWIIGKYPLQAAATQTSAASTHKWALLIGINDYASPTVDNIGARQHAERLRTTLVTRGCRTDCGMVKAGRILTFSSPQSELSYEDPYSHHSVFTWWEVNLGIYGKRADANHDGKVTVEEAFWWSRPYVSAYTRGLQQPYVIDRVSGSMYLN